MPPFCNEIGGRLFFFRAALPFFPRFALSFPPWTLRIASFSFLEHFPLCKIRTDFFVIWISNGPVFNVHSLDRPCLGLPLKTRPFNGFCCQRLVIFLALHFLTSNSLPTMSTAELMLEGSSANGTSQARMNRIGGSLPSFLSLFLSNPVIS